MAVSGVNKNPSERNAEATLHIGQLDDKVSDELLWEFMQQASPVKHVYIPRDRITGKHFGYGFCEFHTPLDAAYALKILNMVRLFDKSVRLSQSAVDRRTQDVGANLFIGNLSEDIDDKLLHDAFSSFGPLIEPAVVMRDSTSGASKSFGFVKYATFEAADSAISIMNDQYVGNRPIVVQYAFKKDGKDRERHGSEAERLLAKRARETYTMSVATSIPQHTLFADRPPPPGSAMSAGPVPAHPPSHSWLQGHVPPQQPPSNAQIGWAPRAPAPSGPVPSWMSSGVGNSTNHSPPS